MWRKVGLGLLLASSSAGCRLEVEPDEAAANLPAYVEDMLSASADAWNRGDLDAFMRDYAASENTTLIGARGLVRGYDRIRQHYATRFEAGAGRGDLRFADVRARRLGAVYGIAAGRWILRDTTGATRAGPFTLVLRRTSAGWKIIHDHSSSDPPPTPD